MSQARKSTAVTQQDADARRFVDEADERRPFWSPACCLSPSPESARGDSTTDIHKPSAPVHVLPAAPPHLTPAAGGADCRALLLRRTPQSSAPCAARTSSASAGIRDCARLAFAGRPEARAEVPPGSARAGATAEREPPGKAASTTSSALSSSTSISLSWTASPFEPTEDCGSTWSSTTPASASAALCALTSSSARRTSARERCLRSSSYDVSPEGATAVSALARHRRKLGPKRKGHAPDS